MFQINNDSIKIGGKKQLKNTDNFITVHLLNV